MKSRRRDQRYISTEASERLSRSHKRWIRPSTAVVTLSLFASGTSTVTGFVQNNGPQVPFTKLHFRHYGDDSLPGNADPAAAAAAMNFIHQSTPQQQQHHQQQQQQQHPEVQRGMPSWLCNQQGHLAEHKLSVLRQAMVNTYLTHTEASTVISAIYDASNGDPNKMAGAADFCLILVDTMEMGMSTLVAAVFHYVTCVTAREKAALFESSLSYSTSSWEQTFSEYISGIEYYDAHAVQIAAGAAHLKRTETVAASLVDNMSSLGRSNARDSANLRSLLLSESHDWRSLAIRSAACLYRLRGINENQNGTNRPLTQNEVRVARDAFHIYSPLASRLGMHRLKNELENAAFRLLYPRQHKKITSLTQRFRLGQTKLKVGDGMRNVLNSVNEKVEQLIQNDPSFKENISEIITSSRVKEPFSLWKKMLKIGTKNILEVPDAIAIRIVLTCRKLSPDEDDELTRARERALSYYVQELLLSQFHPLHDGRFKDYIEYPKQNGYQSLHYTAQTEWGGEQWPFEIQVRSGEMHKVAEYGLAAHWDYKDHLQSTEDDPNTDMFKFQLDQSSVAYLRSVQEWNGRNSPDHVTRSLSASEHEHEVGPYLESFNAAKSSISRENVFIFVSSSDGEESPASGNILELPSGSCVLDALREVERRYGVGVDLRPTANNSFMYNGAEETVTTRLSNADILTISNRNVGYVA